ncbi:MAG: hypothetical protein E7335_02970 [Clostridiales bacterium]|nr:hypothetical protein [Clostridiales bacterium]
MKILFLGNSITRHAPAPDIGWYGDWGMAASCKEKDYIHQLCGILSAAGKKPEVRLRNVADFERDPKRDIPEYFADDLAFGADVAIIRLGENVPEEALDAFAEGIEALIPLLRKQDCTVFVTGRFWKNDQCERILRTIAANTDAHFISLAHLQKETFWALKEFENGGVACHPSDRGMYCIANAIFAAIAEAGLLSGAQIAPIPDGEPPFTGYSVFVDGKFAPLYSVRVSAMPFNREWPGYQRDIAQSELAAMLSMDMSAPVDITIDFPDEIKTAVVRPLSADVSICTEGKQAFFTIRRPGQYSVEINGRHHNLHIFANPPAEKIDRSKYTHYFAAGVHEAGTIILNSGDSMYLEAGAVVHGTLQAFDAENIRIEGRGILDYSRFDRPEPFRHERTGMINFIRCRNITMDGIILRDSSWWTITAANCKNLYFHNLKSVGMWRYNSDGFDFVCSQNVHMDGCFLRNFDDVIVFKGYSLSANGVTPVSPAGKASPPYNLQNVENCLIENCVIWCDWGGALEIGAETVTDEYVNMVFKNCDIIHSSEGAIRIQSGDRAIIHNLLYDNIRIEYDGLEDLPVFQKSDDMVYVPSDTPYLSPVICGWMYCNHWSKAGILGDIHDVTFRNIRVFAPEGFDCPEVRLLSANENHRFHNITIDGFFFNGKEIDIPFNINEFTDVKVVKK